MEQKHDFNFSLGQYDHMFGRRLWTGVNLDILTDHSLNNRYQFVNIILQLSPSSNDCYRVSHTHTACYLSILCRSHWSRSGRWVRCRPLMARPSSRDRSVNVSVCWYDRQICQAQRDGAISEHTRWLYMRTYLCIYEK